MKTVSTIACALLMFAFADLSYAVSVYECEDEQGNRSFYDRCPPGTTAVNEKKFNVKPEKEAAEISATLYLVPKCEACDLVREFFQLRKIALVEKNVDNNIELQNELTEKAGELKVPTVVINDNVISGYDRSELINALKAAGYEDEAKPAAAPNETTNQPAVAEKGAEQESTE